MPPMPYPVTRNGSVIAVQELLNSPRNQAVRRELFAALKSISDLAEPESCQALVQRLLNATTGTTYDAVMAMVEQVGALTLADPEMQQDRWPLSGIYPAMPPIDAGLYHLDVHWFDSHQGGNDSFWPGYKGAAAEQIRAGLVQALELATDDRLDGRYVPIHLTWTCGSPTFEASVSEARGECGELVTVVLVLSTPATRFELAHTQGRIPSKDNFREDQYLFGQAERPVEAVDGEGPLYVPVPDTAPKIAVAQDGEAIVRKPNLHDPEPPAAG